MSESAQANKVILGYTLKERIGAGGYGEVWSAEAPGGFAKAVKLVYGYHDEKRAQTELKAMERVKQVRHPFLLSLERIEIHEGQLVVISELADKSLADLFDEFAASGEQGVPREELLKYMKDAAEGLDYLSETHKLQHLDIKPENLLIVSGHVKVADFGLIKDLQDCSQSLMTGMTPAYAAPELFDGKPCGNSDQYSLAIVYQEMLTAVRPFPGTTPAQLAAQHMHGRPNLRPLPKSDQPIIAKALSKDPAVRFANCREMVEELLNRKLNKKRAIRRLIPNQEKVDAGGTINLGDRDVTAVVSSTSLPFQSVEISTLDPPEFEATQTEFRPTLILSVGDSANKIASKIKQKLALRHGNRDQLPAVAFRCFDSDRNAITRLTMGSEQACMASDEVVELPLQKPEKYREKATTSLGWLPRRWIYNIPRSLQTEGLRPLGRLAFADHFEKICKSLQQALEDISREENIATTSETLGISPAENIRPRVVIVSSISGGLGSGMTLDLAYTIKTLMAERGLPIDTVHGLLLHATNQRSREPGLSSANAFTFLTELRHYNDFGYEGDESLGLPEFQDEPPLDEVYYVDCGSDLGQTQLEAEFNKVAEYVYLNSATRCAAFFDECRKLDDEREHFSLRTFGLSICGPSDHASIALSNILAQRLIQKWTSGELAPGEAEQQQAELWFNQLELHFDGVSNAYADQFHDLLGDEKFAELTQQVNCFATSESPNRANELQEFVDNNFGAPRDRKDSMQVDPAICDTFDQNVARDAVEVGEQISLSVLHGLDTEELDLARQMRLLRACQSRLQILQSRVEEETGCCSEQIDQLFTMISEVSPEQSQLHPEKAELVAQGVESYLQFRIQEFILRYSKEYCRSIATRLSATFSTLERYKSQLGLISKHYADDQVLTNSLHDLDIEQLMLNDVMQRQHEIIELAERHIHETVIVERGGYQAAFNESSCWQKQLPQAIQYTMRSVLSECFKQMSFDNIVSDNQIQAESLVKWLNEMLNLARPRVSQCGGGSRAMVGLPQNADSEVLLPVLKDMFSVNSAQVAGTAGELVFCFEGEDIALANVAYRLLEHRPDAGELAKRIHTRSDIEWTSLNDLL